MTVMLALRALLARVIGLLGVWRHSFQWPRTISEWRCADDASAELLWFKLGAVLRKNGLESWRYKGFVELERPDKALDNGYMRSGRLSSTTRVEHLHITIFQYTTALLRAVRCKSGADFVCKVLVIGTDGQTGLFALRQALSGLSIFQAENHILPLLREIQVDNLTIGVFPMGSSVCLSDVVRESILSEHCSLGDLLHIVVQALEALMFLHEKRVGHRDAFPNNFMVEWMPDSLCQTRRPLAAHPRVWLFDFETAIAFPPSNALDDCRCYGLPFPNVPVESYTRPVPNFILEGQEYNPFELDVWQFVLHLRRLTCANEKVQSLLAEMGDELNAAEELSKVQAMLGEIPPNDLRVPYNKLVSFD
ncbi:hypothetical protein BDZ89DRAFT_1026498 [Hymenopellis radicata]|nr:hypothetical protein BDZ89DRAFT_1026498 [Hymenopellis radicata]